MRLGVSLALVAVVPSVLGVSTADAWQRSFRSAGDPAFTTGAFSVTLDAASNPIVGGGTPAFEVIKLDDDTGAPLWRHADPWPGVALDLASDAGGNVLVAGRIQPLPVVAEAQQAVALKLNGLDGSEMWRWSSAGGGVSEALASLAVDPSGDVFVAGNVASSFFVARLSGADGSELWRYELADSPSTLPYANDVLIAADGDVLVSGRHNQRAIVSKLAALDGQVLWTTEITDPAWEKSTGGAIALDASGDILLCGQYDAASGDSFLVAKLAGGSGNETWRHTVDGIGFCASVQVDAAGDALAAGSFDYWTVKKLAGGTGAELWSTDMSGFDTGARSTALLDNGDLVVGGFAPDAPPPLARYFAVARYSGADGSELWRHAAGARNGLGAFASRLAVNQLGQVFAVGQRGAAPDFTAVKLGDNIGGSKLLAGSSTGGAVADRIVFRSRDKAIFDPAVGSAADPTVNGATFRLRNPGTGESEVINLPSAGWSVRRLPGQARSFLYQDHSGVPGSCRRILVAYSGRLNASCRGATFTLDEATQGALAAQLTLGAGLRYCALFGGTISRDQPGSFQARNSTAVATCSGP